MNKNEEQILLSLKEACLAAPKGAVSELVHTIRRTENVGGVGIALAVLLETALAEALKKAETGTRYKALYVTASTNDGGERRIALRVETIVTLHPACDLWMQGAKSATVKEINVSSTGDVTVYVRPIVQGVYQKTVHPILPRHIMVKARAKECTDG